jgi:hypothetical protein
MHLSSVLLALALSGQSPPVPAASPPQPSAQVPVGAPPPKSQPVAAPPPSGHWAWVPDGPPIQPVAAPPVQTVQYTYPPPQVAQQAVYATAAPVQAQVQLITAQPPTTIQFGGGLISAGLTRAGQCLVHLGSTRTTITLQRTSTRVGMPGPVQTAQYTTTYQVPVQQPTVQIIQQPYQPVGAPPPAQPQLEQAPPPPPAPTPSAQSSVPAPRRVGLGLFH